MSVGHGLGGWRSFGALVALCLVGCAGGPASPSCPEGGWIQDYLEPGFPVGAACVRARRGGGTEVVGWQVSYHDRGDPFYGLEQVDTSRLVVMCVTDAGTTSLARHEVGRLQRSVDPTMRCVERPIGHLWKHLGDKLNELEVARRGD